MKVEIWHEKTSQPVVFKKALLTYQKGSLFCVLLGKSLLDKKSQIVYKYPIEGLFRVKESYV